jgi:hypothetical protein
MTAVEERSLTQRPYAHLSTGRFPCVPCRRPRGIVAERLHSIACAPWDPPPAHARLPPSDQRHGQALHPR